MPGVVIWDNPEQTILHIRLKDVVTSGDYTRIIQQTSAILAAATHRVHLLIDARDAWAADAHFNGAGLPSIERGSAETRGRVIMVNGDANMRALMLNAVLPEAPHFVSSLDEAYRIFNAAEA
jgi:hypothetical protein